MDPAELRSSSKDCLKSGRHFEVLSTTSEELLVFEPILRTLRESAQESSVPRSRHALTLRDHSLSIHRSKTKSVFFEATYLLNEQMQAVLGQIIKRSPFHDSAERICRRALANHYETTLETSSKDFKPLLAPHRDDVGEADVSVVLGITPCSQFRGARLYVSNLKDGRVRYEREGVPSLRCVVGIEVSEGKCVVLRNKVEHYVSTLQQGRRGSLVFHMTKVN